MVRTWTVERRVCPPCAHGDHTAHTGADCHDLIPGGQCQCYAGADRKPPTPGREAHARLCACTACLAVPRCTCGDVGPDGLFASGDERGEHSNLCDVWK